MRAVSKNSVGSGVEAKELIGTTGTLMLPAGKDRPGKVRISLGGKAEDYVASVGPLHPWEAVYAAYFATCLLDANRVESARSIMQSHGRLEPPRHDMTEEDRRDVQNVWDRLATVR